MSDVTLTIDQLIVPMSSLQIKTKIYEILARLNFSTTNWKPGGIARTMISATSIVLAMFSVLVSLVARSAFLSMSTGDWLTLVARHVYGVERILATFAAGTLRVFNDSAAPYSIDADEWTFSNSLTGKLYRNTESFTIAAGQTLSIAIRADEAGSASSAGVGSINAIVTPVLGVTCSNDNAIVGMDTEGDEALIARCMLKPQSASPNGPQAAFEYFARTATRADGTLVGVNRVAVNNSSTTGQAIVTCATPSGALSPSDLQYVFANIANKALPGCVTLTVNSSSDVLVNVEFWAYFDGFELSAADQERYAGPALEQWFATTRIGGSTFLGVGTNRIFRDTIRDVIAAAFPVRPALVLLRSPSVDVVLTEMQTAEPGSVVARAG